VDTLVCRNIGGAASLPKIDAARALGVRVIAVDRPALPEGLRVVAQVDAVLDWLDAL
jgi:precorrin-6A/cobalt-precorrin-6A reductase